MTARDRLTERADPSRRARDRNVWCVKYEWISGASEANCGSMGAYSAFWGDKWDVDKSTCKYQECSYSCPAMPMGIREKRRVYENKEKKKLTNALYRANNKEKRNEYKRLYYDKNKGKSIE